MSDYFYKKNLFIYPYIEKLGLFCFLLGIFFLASAVGISILLLTLSVLLSFLRPYKFLKDKWNFPLLICGLWMIISTIIHFQRYEEYINLDIDPKLSLIGLANWIPFFFCFWGFQNYLNTPKKRLIASKILISGSVPVIFSGILQLLNVNGPFEFFFGLVVWFQKPIQDIGSLAGLFNNQNYAGLWMVMVWPLCLSELITPRKSLFRKFILFTLSFLFVGFIFLTDSRNAILGLILSSPIVLGYANLVWYLPIIFLGFLLLGLTVLPIIPIEIKIFMESIIPARIYTLFPEIGFENIKSYPRINKWISSISFISNKPFFGWGAATFPILYSFKGESFGHAHNLPIEIAISYGIIPSIIIFSFYAAILYLSFKQIFQLFNTNELDIHYFLNNKAWFSAFLIFILCHLFDIQYFDARISTLSWILIAGLRCILREKKDYNHTN